MPLRPRRDRRMFAFNTLRGEIMQHVFVELYNYGPAWAKRSENERTDFVNTVIEAVNRSKSAGVEVIARDGPLCSSQVVD